MSLYVDIEMTFPDFRLSAQVECENEVIALLGGSGCGKSLTLKCISGIENPDKGRVVINGKTVFDKEKGINLPPQKRKVGYLFQNYALFPNMTVWNNIACVIQKPKNLRHEIVQGIIKKFQLDGVKNLYPRQISGGQQQRTALARILVSEPEILMLDEPFSALDTHLKWHMEQEVASVLEDFHGTAIFVSHNRDEVYRLSDKIAIMDDGRIETTGTKKDIFDSPRTLAAALMTGCKNISKAQKHDEFHVKATDWGIILRTDSVVPDSVKHVGVRAHHLQSVFVKEKNGDNIFPCQIHKAVDEPFEKIFVFSFATDANNGTKLQIELPKDVCGEWDSNEFLIRVPANKIMCLE